MSGGFSSGFSLGFRVDDEAIHMGNISQGFRFRGLYEYRNGRYRRIEDDYLARRLGRQGW